MDSSFSILIIESYNYLLKETRSMKNAIVKASTQYINVLLKFGA